MTNAAQVDGDSSVLFNLRQLMKLEEERVAGEEEALRRAQEHARLEGERLAREAAQAAQRKAQTERDDAQRAEQERAAALLRVQLVAAAAERAGEQRLRDEHGREVEAVRADSAHARTRLLRSASFALALVTTLAGASHWASWQRTAEARGAAQAAATLAAAQARELAELRTRLTATQAEVRQSAPIAPQPTAAAAPHTGQAHARTLRRVRAERTVPANTNRTSMNQAVPELDLDGDARDPIEGL